MARILLLYLAQSLPMDHLLRAPVRLTSVQLHVKDILLLLSSQSRAKVQLVQTLMTLILGTLVTVMRLLLNLSLPQRKRTMIRMVRTIVLNLEETQMQGRLDTHARILSERVRQD